MTVNTIDLFLFKSLILQQTVKPFAKKKIKTEIIEVTVLSVLYISSNFLL